MAGINFEITVNNADLVKNLVEEVAIKTLEMWGILAEGYAIGICPVDTGTLRNSIAHEVDEAENCVEYGTNVEYGIYIEYGTGIYAENGDGRQTPWFYVDDRGEGHWTRGNKPQPFIRPAITEHTDEYKDILYENCINA